jgi:hypothetical protein
MLAQLLHAAKERLRRLPMRVRGEHAARAWFREYWYEDDRESRGLKLLREWLSPEQLVQLKGKDISTSRAATPAGDTGSNTASP